MRYLAVILDSKLMFAGSQLMNSYRVRVQVVTWYEVVVQGRSSNEAIASAEGLTPTHIQSTGNLVETETGLADPASVHPIEPA